MTVTLIFVALGVVLCLLSRLARGSMRRLAVTGAVLALIVTVFFPLIAGAGFLSSQEVDPTLLALLPVAPALVLVPLLAVGVLLLVRRGGRGAALLNLIAGVVVTGLLLWFVATPARLVHLVPLPVLMELVTGLLVLGIVLAFVAPRPRWRLGGLIVGVVLGAVTTIFLLSGAGRTVLPNVGGYYQFTRATSSAENQQVVSAYNAGLDQKNAIRELSGLPKLTAIQGVAQLTEQGVPRDLAEQGYRILRPASTQYGLPVLALAAGLLLGAGLLALRPNPAQAPVVDDPPADWRGGAILASVLGLLVPSFFATNFNLNTLIKGAPFLRDFATRSWPPLLAQVDPQNPATNVFPLQEVLSQMALTVEIALVGTFVAAIFAVPLSFLAARNLTLRNPFMNFLYGLTRTFFNVDRGIDTLILALIFVAAVGLGPFAGVLAMAIHSVADLGKLYSEAIENSDKGPVEALESVGTSGTNVLRWAILPQVLPLFTSYTLYRFEINFRVSIVLGFVGAGGIGFFIQGAMQSGHYNQMIIGVIAIVLVVNLIDFLSSEVRRRLV